MNKSQQKIVIRTVWTVALIWQCVLYYEAFPLLLARVIKNHLPGSPVANVVGYDLIGAGAWLMLLLFLEERPLRGSKWLDYTSIAAFVVLTACIVLTSMTAWA